MKLLTAFIALLFVFNTSGYSQDKTFSFKAQVHFKGSTLKGATIEVYEGGDLVYETLSKGGGRFQFDLQAEKQYMVEVSMENMRLKTIWINMKGTQDLDFRVPVFAFHVHLEEEEITPYDELSEIPVTLIKFQPKKKEFYMDKTYANAVKAKKKEIKSNTLKIR